MKGLRIFLTSLISVALLGGCEWSLEPNDDNHSTFERVYDDPSFAEGLLITAYTLIPTNDYRFDEPATDDAVTNDFASSYLNMATGQWASNYDPQNMWTNCNRGILYINHFLTIVNDVPWKPSDLEIQNLYIRRLTGEAYAMRGILRYFLLRNHAGPGASSGQMLGIQIFDDVITEDEMNAPRKSFTESVQAINSDFDKALTYLPAAFGDQSSVPSGFSEVTKVYSYNYVMGNINRQRVDGNVVRAFKGRLALLAASPAFNTNNDASLWETAARSNAELIDLSKLESTGYLFYLGAQISSGIITSGDNQDNYEIVWRRPYVTNNTWETSHFPPGLYGSGRINPTQNLVDAFPMKNGYPISDSKSDYDPSNPYADRDPRLSAYIIYDGMTYKSRVIKTGQGTGATNDGLEATTTSTRTGYYMKKLLREEANPNPSAQSTQQHIPIHIRRTELFLNYAEAANEVWGPTTSPIGFTAKDVIAALRKRGGIAQPDEYLESVTTKEAMRELIRNERRIELCFESHRFWDIRRWKADIAQPARGVVITYGADNTPSYTYRDVEGRAYQNYMYYGPVPYTEILKFDGLEQNAGW
ncbi:MAG: RagB/SusD family nutrient uptake outer membrane protein [Tannerella sp.]|jgi:hypothetical protein|nr:RagB/SusD family nutrient uptake outer membrane protein [Tannerella sp.]